MSNMVAQRVQQLLWQQQLLQHQAVMIQQQLHMYTAGAAPVLAADQQLQLLQQQHNVHGHSGSGQAPDSAAPSNSRPIMPLGVDVLGPVMAGQQAAWPAAQLPQPYQQLPLADAAAIAPNSSWPSLTQAAPTTCWEELHSCYSLPMLPWADTQARTALPPAPEAVRAALQAMHDTSGNPFV